jgi:hypothetical protein
MDAAPTRRVYDPAPAAAQAGRAVEDQLLLAAFARIRPVAMGLSTGLLAGALVLAATAIVLLEARLRDIQGPVGPHLELLRHFFPGYRVTWPGAFAGFGYGFVYGFVPGFLLAGLVNLSHAVYVRRLVRRMRGGAMTNDL